jgi:hypothetical protein
MELDTEPEPGVEVYHRLPDHICSPHRSELPHFYHAMHDSDEYLDPDNFETFELAHHLHEINRWLKDCETASGMMSRAKDGRMSYLQHQGSSYCCF